MRPDFPYTRAADVAHQPANEAGATEELVRAVAGHDAQSQLPVVNRTRRAIRIADENRREQGARGRRHIGITLFVFGAIFLVLAPAMWGTLDGFVGGEHFSDLTAQVTLVSTLLTLAVVGALAAFWRGRSGQDQHR